MSSTQNVLTPSSAQSLLYSGILFCVNVCSDLGVLVKHFPQLLFWYVSGLWRFKSVMIIE